MGTGDLCEPLKGVEKVGDHGSPRTYIAPYPALPAEDKQRYEKYKIPCQCFKRSLTTVSDKDSMKRSRDELG